MSTTSLKLSWDAYTSGHFDRIYNQHAASIGHRPVFSIRHGGDHARVTTTPEDFDAARAIITELENASA